MLPFEGDKKQDLPESPPWLLQLQGSVVSVLLQL